MERLFVLLKREFRLRISYRMTAVLTLVSVVTGLFSYGLLGNTAVVSTTAQTYGMSLTSFLVSGVAFSSIVNSGFALFYPYVAPTQIEEVLVTPVDFREFLLQSSFFGILTSIASTTLLFLASVLIFDLSFSYDLTMLVAFTALGLISSIGLGFIGVSFQLIYKQMYVLSWLFYSLSSIIGNMVVPVQILPGFLQVVSYMSPQYYFFTGIREALGAQVASPIQPLAPFVIYTLILLAIGLASLKHSLSVVRRDGTLRWS